MVTVVQRPQGHKIIDQAISSSIIDYSGDALVDQPLHGLNSGDVVYIASDIEEYNGFLEVLWIGANGFKILVDGVPIPFYQEIDITYYQTQEHDWNSIFLPIVYKISNDKWPTNSVDSVNLIVLNSDDNGFTSLTLAAPLPANALEFIKISGASTAEANGVWQIVEVVLSNVLVINLPFELSGSLVGASVQYYYNNYQVKVKVFAGLAASHPWEPHKPYTEVAELSLTPDDNNLVMFSIADYIKMKVAIKNNLTLFSLPLNLDAFTGFYISTAESYDDSDNYSLLTNESSFTDDTFEGYAIAGKLEFKNVYSGDYADFVYTSGSPARWLTNRSRLLAVERYYFDISFIKNIVGDFFVRITKYISDYGINEDIQYTDQGIGVYRIPITPDANYDSFCIAVFSSLGDLLDNTDFVSNPGPDIAWTTGASPSVILPGTGLFSPATSEDLAVDYAFVSGNTYTITTQYTRVVNSGSSNPRTTTLQIMDSSFNVLFSSTFAANAGSNTNNITFLANAATSKIAIKHSSGSNVTITINAVSVLEVGLSITEEICIDMLEACDVRNGFVTTEGIRLLEDGGYRLLE